MHKCRNAGKPIKGSKDSDDSLVLNKNLTEKIGSLDWDPEQRKVGHKNAKVRQPTHLAIAGLKDPVRSSLKTINRQWGSLQLMSFILSLSFAFHHDHNTFKMHFCYPAPFPSPRICQGALKISSCTSILSSCCCKIPGVSIPCFDFRWWRRAMCHLRGNATLFLSSLLTEAWILEFFLTSLSYWTSSAVFLSSQIFQRPFSQLFFSALYNTQCLNRRVFRTIYLLKVKVTSKAGQSSEGGVLKERLWTTGLGSMHPQSWRLHTGR